VVCPSEMMRRCGLKVMLPRRVLILTVSHVLSSSATREVCQVLYIYYFLSITLQIYKMARRCASGDDKTGGSLASPPNCLAAPLPHSDALRRLTATQRGSSARNTLICKE